MRPATSFTVAYQNPRLSVRLSKVSDWLTLNVGIATLVRQSVPRKNFPVAQQQYSEPGNLRAAPVPNNTCCVENWNGGCIPNLARPDPSHSCESRRIVTRAERRRMQAGLPTPRHKTFSLERGRTNVETMPGENLTNAGCGRVRRGPVSLPRCSTLHPVNANFLCALAYCITFRHYALVNTNLLPRVPVFK